MTMETFLRSTILSVVFGNVDDDSLQCDLTKKSINIELSKCLIDSVAEHYRAIGWVICCTALTIEDG